MHTIILAALLMLNPGINDVGVAGEVVAIEAATTNATGTIKIQSVQSITAYTNATAKVIRYETAFALTYTNMIGGAAIATNVIGYVDYGYFNTNGVRQIVSGPNRFDMPITNTVVTATVPSATYAKTNTLATVTTSSHFGSVTNQHPYILGEPILVSGAKDGDIVKILIN